MHAWTPVVRKEFLSVRSIHALVSTEPLCILLSRQQYTYRSSLIEATSFVVKTQYCYTSEQASGHYPILDQQFTQDFPPGIVHFYSFLLTKSTNHVQKWPLNLCSCHNDKLARLHSIMSKPEKMGYMATMNQMTDGQMPSGIERWRGE